MSVKPAADATVYLTDNNDIYHNGTGNDTIYGLGGNDLIDGGVGNDVIYGGSGNDALLGGLGNDVLDGGTGSDVMTGGAGSDTYYVDDAGDVVIELGIPGVDTVNSTISYSLTANVENLVLVAGAGDISGTGNGLANTITGNEGNNVIDGGAGADTMIGGLGDDTYYVDNAGDVITELANGGHDLVYSSISYTLPSFVEDVTLTGTADIDATGNTQSNIINGNSGANTLDGGIGNDALYGNDGSDTLIGGGGADHLDGGTGADSMSGGVGNDSYVVDNSGDVITENLHEGTDTVDSSISYTLTANVENLNLTAGAGDIDGTGNELANVIVGNEGANVIDGGLGNDTLTGGAGGDTFLFDTTLNKTTNVDTITDFTVGSDTIELDHSIFSALGTGALDASEFHLGKTAVTSSQHILYDAPTGNVYYDADGHGGAAAVLFAHVTAGTALSEHDFFVI